MNAEPKTDQTQDREKLRAMLTRLQDRTFQRIKYLRRDQEEESESGPGDEMDSARTTEEVETHAGLIAREEEKFKYLDEALTRLDAGDYGRCRRCGGAIPLERLMAVPFTSFCIYCQDEPKRAGRSWGEGGVIAPYDHQWTPPEEMETPPDREYKSTDPEEQLTISVHEPVAPEAAKKKRPSPRNKPAPRHKRSR
jgi:RNA polymerase-binding transcription factor